jgi:hypothetical protein
MAFEKFRVPAVSALEEAHWGQHYPSRGMLRMTFILQPQRGQGVSVVWSSPIPKRERRILALR